MGKARVLLAEDHTVVAAGLESLLKNTFDLLGTVQDGRTLVERAQALRPDVIVTDVSMPLLNGIDAIRQLQGHHNPARIVVLTMHKDPQLAVDAFRAGASSFLLKVSPVDELITAIEEVANGRYYLTTLLGIDLTSLLIEARGEVRAESSVLTPRQREVLQLIAEGMTMKEVAKVLEISPRTAESHKYDIMQILGVDTTAELVQYAMRSRLIIE